MPTCVDLAGMRYPDASAGRSLKPIEGTSLVPILRGKPTHDRRVLYFEHEGGRAILDGDWKLVARGGGAWELYHVARDANETRDLANREPARVAEMSALWRSWARRVGCTIPVQPR